jgi:hypothetical protein
MKKKDEKIESIIALPSNGKGKIKPQTPPFLTAKPTTNLRMCTAKGQ